MGEELDSVILGSKPALELHSAADSKSHCSGAVTQNMGGVVAAERTGCILPGSSGLQFPGFCDCGPWQWHWQRALEPQPTKGET